MRNFDYRAPRALDEALALLGPRARALAGGTDLLTLMKADLAAPERLVSVRALLPRGIEPDAEGLTIGAATTLADIETDERVRSRYGALAEAAGLAASPPLRNMATLGGNLLQRPRCWYFRNPRLDCWLKGGESCPARDGENRLHAIYGDGPCRAAHPSDLAPALVALDAEVRLRGPRGERALPLERFFAAPEADRRTETRLAEDELVLAVRVPPPPGGARSVYLKAMDRAAWAFALAGAAAAIGLAEGRIAHARIVLSGVAPVPWRAEAAERVLAGAPPSADTFEKAAQAALQGASPLRHNGYKGTLVRALVRRALRKLAS